MIFRRQTTTSTSLWGELELAAYGTVRRFLQSVSDDPRNKGRLTRLASDAHKALYRVERAHGLNEIDKGSMEHP